MKRLKHFIRKQWGINISVEDIEKDASLMVLAEYIACESEKCSLEEAYQMYIGIQDLNLPRVIAIMIADEMGWDMKKVNAHMTLRQLLED